MTVNFSATRCEIDGEVLLTPDEINQSMMAIVDQELQALGCESVGLMDLLGRVLAQDILSPINVPRFTHSAMDGYAFRAGSEDASGGLVVVDRILAGDSVGKALLPGQAVSIMTGAPLPSGADTVMVSEMCELDPDTATLRFNSEYCQGQNIRWQGEELEIGQPVMSKGCRLDAPRIAQLATLGLAQVEVYKLIKVAILSTGKELCEPSTVLNEQQIFDSNRYALSALLHSHIPCVIKDYGIVDDCADSLKRVLLQAAAENDVVISSAGISTGDADYVKEAIDDIGALRFCRLKMRPGRPLSYGFIAAQAQKKLFIGLPGNPAAVQITFTVCVQPLLLRIAGCHVDDTAPKRMMAQLTHDLRCKAGRVDYIRAHVEQVENGQWWVTQHQKQGAAQLSSLIESNCLIEIAEDCVKAESGDQVGLITLF